MVYPRALIAAVVLALVLAACGGTTRFTNSNIIRGSGVVKTETRDVSGGFTAVEIGGSGELVVTAGEADALTIEAEDNILPLLTSDVKDGKLTLDVKPNSSIGPTRPYIYRLTVKDMQSLTVAAAAAGVVDSYEADTLTLVVNNAARLTVGTLTVHDKLDLSMDASGRFDANTISSPAVTLNADSASAVNIRNLTTGQLTATTLASADVILAGTALVQAITAESASVYDARNLAGETVTVEAAQSADVHVNVSGTLNAAASSSAEIIYYGDPQVEQETSESGTIRQG